MIQRRVFIRGRVQGVFFRASLVNEAGKYPSIRGYVRNRRDGRVEAVIAGPEAEVQALLDWCRKGPPGAQVTGMDVTEEPFQATFPDFRRSDTV